jgi:HK97 family phage prohead protease
MEYKSLSFEHKADVEGRTFSGYASTFGNVDAVGDTIQRGAFAQSISERLPAKQIKVLWQHSDPIGLPSLMREDERGLYVEGVISKTRLGDEALELMKDGVVDRLSIGFSVKDSEEIESGRLIKSVTLYEFSPVTFPADSYAEIIGVKQMVDDITSIESRKDVERILRKSGFSRQAASTFVSRVQNLKEQGKPEVADSVAELIKSRRLFALNVALRSRNNVC